MVNQEDIAEALTQVREFVAGGLSISEATTKAAKEWDVPLRALEARVAKTGWTEEGVRNSAQATKAPSKSEELEQEILVLCKRYGVDRSSCVEVIAHGDRWTVVGRVTDTFAVGVRHKDLLTARPRLSQITKVLA